MVFGRPKKEVKPDTRAEAVILELEWEDDLRSKQIVADAKILMRMGKFGYTFVGSNDELMTRWTEPSTRVILTFYWGEDEFHHIPLRKIDCNLTDFNKFNLSEAQLKKKANDASPRKRGGKKQR